MRRTRHRRLDKCKKTRIAGGGQAFKSPRDLEKSGRADPGVHGGTMSYRNKTYVIFDGDKDMWAYGRMKGWKVNDRVDFDFHDAHELMTLTDRASEPRVKQVLKQRLANTRQAIVLIGESTRHLYRYVRWELEACQEMQIPMVIVNLNGRRDMDADRCPPIIRDDYAVHVSFNMRIIRFALDHFPDEYRKRPMGASGYRVYSPKIYSDLEL